MSETTLFCKKGEPVAYLAHHDNDTIYTFAGKPCAYTDGENVYGFNGKHLGWFEKGVLWDHDGNRVGVVEAACPTATSFEPFKSFKSFKPFKSFKDFAPFRPFLHTFTDSRTSLGSFLNNGAR